MTWLSLISLVLGRKNGGKGADDGKGYGIDGGTWLMGIPTEKLPEERFVKSPEALASHDQSLSCESREVASGLR